MSQSKNSVFSDFCQAWVSRFPGSELPAAWEEDVRANLKKHKDKVCSLREELEKEEMYVEYLDKLLLDIERHRKNSNAIDVTSTKDDSKSSLNNNQTHHSNGGICKQKFLDDHLADFSTSSNTNTKLISNECETNKIRDSLRLDLNNQPTREDDDTSYVTVINVASNAAAASKKTNEKQQQQQLAPGSSLTFTKSRKTNSESALKKVPPKPPPKRLSAGSRDSLNSVSSPTTPTSCTNDDFITGPREGLDTLSPKDPLLQNKLSSSSEDEGVLDTEANDDRGRPDGRDNEDNLKRLAAVNSQQPRNKIKELMANWENKSAMIGSKPNIAPRSIDLDDKHLLPQRITKRKNSDSSRGRMGSPSGKSHESSDSETSLSRSHKYSHDSLKNVPGEARLDRLVRRPSGERSKSHRHSEALPTPPLPNALKKPKAKPRNFASIEEPLYDTVADDEPEDEYDNHLIYGLSSTNKTDTLESSGGRSSSADLGFDEPSHQNHNISGSKNPHSQSGTLSSSDLDGFSSPSLKRIPSSEEEGNYVNIQYFMETRENSLPKRMDTILSEDDHCSSSSSREDLLDRSSEEADHSLMYKCILNNIFESETLYLEGLSVMLQYMKAMKVTLSTPQPLIPKEDFDIIFYKIPELHDLHLTFHEELQKKIDRSNIDSIGETFKMLASRTKIYALFLNNYQKALDSLHRCINAYPNFAELARSIKLRTVKGQKQSQTLSLEDLLHNPVARVQKHCLCLQDLIKYTPKSDKNYVTLNEALGKVQNFLREYNVMHASELFPHQERHQRHLVKNSFIVELYEGHRKLRHLFLYNDVLVCAKYKPSNRKSEHFTFQLKWFVPLWNALVVEEPSMEPKENSPANIVSLKTQASSLRGQIRRIEKEEEWKGSRRSSNSSNHSSVNNLSALKSTEKHRKKLGEIERQLVLAAPSLHFQVTHKQTGKTYTFYISSEFERSQWVETLQVLQSSLSSNPSFDLNKVNMSVVDLQALITSSPKLLNTSMGSFLMRCPRDEPLLVGDIHFNLNYLHGLTKPSDIYIVLEVDSYGHFFRKHKSKIICNTLEPVWNEDFIIELEGSENLRILVYEQQSQGNILKGRATLELSRTWLSEKSVEQRVSINDVILTYSIKFVTFDKTMRRVPHSKSSAGLFGTSIEVSSKKEKRAVPFIITSCLREVERRGISEVGIYRVSGSAVDVGKLKKAYETNPYEAEQLLKECDIHSVAGILKLFLRDLPESLFTNEIYKQMFDAFHIQDQEERKHRYLSLFSQIPQSPNQTCIVYLIEHMVRVSQFEAQNKMSLHNLATVFGPTLLHAGVERDKKSATNRDQLTTGTVDVMAQAGILYFFLSRRARGEPIQIVERQV